MVVAAVGITLIVLADGASIDAVLDIAPWLVGFAAMNAAMEELWFRGFSLQPYVGLGFVVAPEFIEIG